MFYLKTKNEDVFQGKKVKIDRVGLTNRGQGFWVRHTAGYSEIETFLELRSTNK